MATSGNLDVVTHHHIAGWAWDSEAPNEPVSLVFTCAGQVLARTLADRYRSDLAAAGFGDGRHSFDIALSPPLSRLSANTISVRCEHTGVHLAGSPVQLEPVLSLDETAQNSIARFFSAPADADELYRRLQFLMLQADALRHRHADAQSGLGEREDRRRSRWSEPGIGGAAAEVGSLLDPRALVIDDRVPLVAHDAGSNAILSHMRSLRRLGYDVSLAPANLCGDTAVLDAEGIGCCLPPWYASIEEVLRRQRDSFELVYLHRVTTAARYVALVRDHQPHARIVYSVADLHHLRLSRQAEIEGRPELAAHAEDVRLCELTAAWQADAVITHSTTEAAVLRRHMRADKVHVVPWTLASAPTAVPFAERRGFAFIGGYGHQPNVDAAFWLVDHVVPALAAKGADIPCLLVGSDMPDGLRNLRRHGVEPIGFVPSLSALFDRVRLTVAPLSYGAGVKGKVLDSLAAGVPCVCTPAAAEGLELPAALLDLVASSPEELAAAVLRLHDDEALHKTCRDAGLAYIADTTSEERVDTLMREVVRSGKVG